MLPARPREAVGRAAAGRLRAVGGERRLQRRQRLAQAADEIGHRVQRALPGRAVGELAEEPCRLPALALLARVLVEARHVEQAIATGHDEHAAGTQQRRGVGEERRVVGQVLQQPERRHRVGAAVGDARAQRVVDTEAHARAQLGRQRGPPRLRLGDHALGDVHAERGEAERRALQTQIAAAAPEVDESPARSIETLQHGREGEADAARADRIDGGIRAIVVGPGQPGLRALREVTLRVTDVRHRPLTRNVSRASTRIPGP